MRHTSDPSQPSVLSRLLPIAVGAAAAWGALAAPALAIGQVFVFRDPVLTQRYAKLEASLTLLQVQAEADKLQAKMRGQKVGVRAVIQEVYPPEGYDGVCKVLVALRGVTGFTAPELPVVSYLVPKGKAIALRRNGGLVLYGKLYAIDRNGAVAVELDAPAGWRDPVAQEAGGER